MELEQLMQERLQLAKKEFVYMSKLLNYLNNPSISSSNSQSKKDSSCLKQDLLLFKTLEEAKWKILSDSTLSHLLSQSSKYSKYSYSDYHRVHNISDLGLNFFTKIDSESSEKISSIHRESSIMTPSSQMSKEKEGKEPNLENANGGKYSTPKTKLKKYDYSK